MQLAASINMFAHRLCFLPLVFFFRLGRFQEIFVVLVVTFCLAITPLSIACHALHLPPLSALLAFLLCFLSERPKPPVKSLGYHYLALDTSVWYNNCMDYKSNCNVVYSCKYHVVWCPKYRRKVLVNGVDERLKSLIQEICVERSFTLIEIEVMPDHVHLLIEVDPQFGIHRAIKLIKGTTSRVLRQEFPWLRSRLPSLWTNSYFVSTVGGARISTIKKYIENQKTV